MKIDKSVEVNENNEWSRVEAYCFQPEEKNKTWVIRLSTRSGQMDMTYLQFESIKRCINIFESEIMIY